MMFLLAAAADAVPTGDASGSADPGVVVPLPTATPILDEPVAGAEGLKNAVAAKSGTIGQLIDTLDALGQGAGQGFGFEVIAEARHIAGGGAHRGGRLHETMGALLLIHGFSSGNCCGVNG